MRYKINVHDSSWFLFSQKNKKIMYKSHQNKSKHSPQQLKLLICFLQVGCSYSTFRVAAVAVSKAV